MIIIKNAHMLDVTDLVYKDVDILIDGTVIKEIGTFNIADYPNCEVIDAAGRLVTPGLVDSHCHVGMMEEVTGWAGDDTNEMTDPIYPEMRAIDAIKPHDEAFENAMRAGITTVVTGPGSGEVIGGTFCALKTYGKTVADMCLREEVAMKAALGENPKRCFGMRSGKLPSTRMGSAALLRESLTKARIYKEKQDKYKAKIAAGDVDATEPEFNMKWASLSRVFDGMIMKIHAHQQDDIATAIRIAEEFGVKITIEHCTEGYIIADYLKEKGVGAIIGPLMTNKSKIELRNKSFEAGAVLKNAGVPFAIMTDHPVIPLEHTLAQAAVFIRHGLTAEEVLQALTINAANLAEVGDRVGSIEIGKDADIVIWSGDPFHYLTNVDMVMINGKIV